MQRGGGAERAIMIAHGLPIYVALEPVDMRMAYERLEAGEGENADGAKSASAVRVRWQTREVGFVLLLLVKSQANAESLGPAKQRCCLVVER